MHLRGLPSDSVFISVDFMHSDFYEDEQDWILSPSIIFYLNHWHYL